MFKDGFVAKLHMNRRIQIAIAYSILCAVTLTVSHDHSSICGGFGGSTPFTK